MASKKLRGSGAEKNLSSIEQEAKIIEIRKLLGPIADKFPGLCSDASILRYLRARNWNTKKANKMLKEAIKWRLEYRPDKIRWEDVAHEAETGKLYVANYYDKHGRTVLVMRPGLQNTTCTPDQQIKYLVYCMERAIMDLKPDQEQMVWLIDFQGWNMSKISVKVTKETAHVLQDCYPERLALAILYNPPKVFESFWLMVKPFLEQKTYRKVKFIFPNDPQGQKTVEDLVEVDKLEHIFGGKNTIGFDYEAYAERMKEEDKKMLDFCDLGGSSPCPSSTMSELQQSDIGSEASDEGGFSSNDENAFSNLEAIDQKIDDTLSNCQDKKNVEVLDPKMERNMNEEGKLPK